MKAHADNHLIRFPLNLLEDFLVVPVDSLVDLADSRAVPVVDLVGLAVDPVDLADSRVDPAVSLVGLVVSLVDPAVSLVDRVVSLVDQAGLVPKCQQHLLLRSLLLWRQH